MTIENYKRAQDLVEQCTRSQNALDEIKKIDPAYLRINDGNISIRIASVVDPPILEMLKTMLVAHLDAKITALETEFEALGGGAREGN